jgi:undecaprenyl-diphosphatase
LAADGATVLHGRRGWRRAAARYLERAGVQPEAARQGIARFTAGAVVAALAVAVVMLILGLVEGQLTAWRAPAALVPTALLGAGACGLVLLGQWLTGRNDGPSERAAVRGSRATLRRLWLRRRAGSADTAARWRGGHLGWSVAAVVLEAAVLAAVLHAVGGGLSLLETLSLYAVLHLVWSAVPVTGTPGAADLVLLIVLTSLAAPLAAACAAVLAFRLLTFWFPAAVGALLNGPFERRLLL